MTVAQEFEGFGVTARTLIAMGTETTVETLAKLSEDPAPRVRRRVAANPNTPLNVLLWLLDDPVKVVGKTVKSNPTYRDHVIQTLSIELGINKEDLPQEWWEELL